MLVDAHTHLDHYDAATLETVMAEIERFSVKSIAVATDVPSYQKTIAIAGRSPLIVPVFGIHPAQAARWVDRLDELAPFLAETPMFGEIGLDFHWVEDQQTYPAQRQVFTFFLKAAQAQDKPVNLHTKGAEAEIADLLARYSLRRVIVHWYSGPDGPFYELLSLGCAFTVGVEVLHSESIAALVQQITLERLLTETDGTSGLAWLTGETGMPHHIEPVLERIATLKGVDVPTVREVVASNLEGLLER
jgi:TatD DNase family protein